MNSGSSQGKRGRGQSGKAGNDARQGSQTPKRYDGGASGEATAKQSGGGAEKETHNAQPIDHS